MPTLYIVGIVIAVIIFLCIFVTVCYKKAPPTEAIVITGLGHREPKVVCGKGAFVIPFVQRADSLDMRIMKMDVKTPETGVDSVVTAQVYSDNSSISDDETQELGAKSKAEYITARQQMAISNFLGMEEEEINEKVNDVLQGNLREIVAEMSVMDVLTKRKEFAQRVLPKRTMNSLCVRQN